MPRLPNRLWSWPALAGVALSVLVQSGHAATSITDPAAFLNQTESLSTRNHPEFVQRLAQIRPEASSLAPDERWHLRYLDAWETMFEGDYGTSETQLRDVINHSGDATLITKASALLLMNLGFNQRYEEAYALANQLTRELPNIKDPMARYMVLMYLSQMLDFAGQIDLSLKYAHMMESGIPAEKTRCLPLNLEVAALYNGKRLTSTSPQLQQAIDACAAPPQPVDTNSILLVQSNLYLDENQPRKAIALLDRIAPSLRTNHYYPHLFSAKVQRAIAYAKLGDDNQAIHTALAAVAMSHPGEISEWLMEAYRVLYQAEKRQGNSAAALGYYEHFVSQNKKYLDDINASALAYETVQQHVRMQQLETEKLSKQNSILLLKQSLSAKASETSRLYIALLLMTLAFLALWLYRIKRSQLHFKRLSHHDGFTGIYNHQHFIDEAGHALHVLAKKAAPACLISIDLDHFKHINDAHGHAMGDIVLKRTVVLCQHHLRPADLFGRLGGEEFGILLHGCSRKQGLEIANRIRITIDSTPTEQDGIVVSVSASIGMASTETSGYDLQRLCADADIALYRAKRAGRNRVIADAEDDTLHKS